MSILQEIEDRLDVNVRESAWKKGVREYALELVENLKEYAEYEGKEPCNVNLLGKAMLNGASDWSQYSWGGCSLIYNGEIAERLCTPSFLEKKHGGELPPGKGLEWLDWQAFALADAARMIKREFNSLTKK